MGNKVLLPAKQIKELGLVKRYYLTLFADEAAPAGDREVVVTSDEHDIMRSSDGEEVYDDKYFEINPDFICVGLRIGMEDTIVIAGAKSRRNDAFVKWGTSSPTINWTAGLPGDAYLHFEFIRKSDFGGYASVPDHFKSE